MEPSNMSVLLAVPSRSLGGEYVEAGSEHHGRPVFVKRAPGGPRQSSGTVHTPFYCYFWDAPEGPSEWRGWWIGSEVGGNRVSAFVPEARDKAIACQCPAAVDHVPSPTPPAGHATADMGAGTGAVAPAACRGAAAELRPGRAPSCPSADHLMDWVVQPSYTDYICNRCGDSLRGERWHCAEHQDDFCPSCGFCEAFGLPGANAPDSNDGAQWPPVVTADMRPPTQGWQVFGLSQTDREVSGEELTPA